jgi:hypothetical protein
MCAQTLRVCSFTDLRSSVAAGLSYGERALLRSYLCPDIKEGSEQVRWLCTSHAADGVFVSPRSTSFANTLCAADCDRCL